MCESRVVTLGLRALLDGFMVSSCSVIKIICIGDTVCGFVGDG